MRHIQTLINEKQFEQALIEAEKYIYLAAYEHSGRNQSATARILGVSRGTVIAKLKEYLK
jgi:transcriptional regulator with PAS, ATPase and Fis domain